MPSSGFLSRPAGAAEGVRQVDLPEEAEIRQKIVSSQDFLLDAVDYLSSSLSDHDRAGQVSWDQARVQENEAIRKLKKVIKNERK